MSSRDRRWAGWSLSPLTQLGVYLAYGALIVGGVLAITFSPLWALPCFTLMTWLGVSVIRHDHRTELAEALDTVHWFTEQARLDAKDR